MPIDSNDMMNTNFATFIEKEFKSPQTTDMDLISIENETFYKISEVDSMRPFFMSIVSDSNHWLFISSNGGLTAGRKNADLALFPYYTDDKITELADITGSKTIFQVHHNQKTFLWEPFTDRFNENTNCTRNLYKSTYGNKIIFEEVHQDLGLTFQYKWSSSNRFGFVKTSKIINNSSHDYGLTVLDGLQNILPHGVESQLQTTTSNLVDAYKRNELIAESGLGLYTLSAIIVDKAEPSEALKANVVWSTGIENPLHLLSSLQLKQFRKKMVLTPETDIKGEKGAYFISCDLHLEKQASKTWHIIANVNQDQLQVLALSDAICKDPTLPQEVTDDIDTGTQNLVTLVAAADGLHYTADHQQDTRHFSNVLFNIMRGGIFDQQYQIEKSDFLPYIQKANQLVYEKNKLFLSELPAVFNASDLKVNLDLTEDYDLFRLCIEYLPLKFSRRHGDPSRPWNKFSINTHSDTDGSKILDYEGNWRDIFQNWEALAWAYPDFIEGMIHKFLNASTFDGYNPYRVTKDGFDWETIEPDNPWSYIGYWGDHQIIYLLKFLEFKEKYQPNSLQWYFDRECFVYAAVPYQIKPYSEILKNPKDTIVFDHQWEAKIHKRKSEIGADGAILRDNNNSIYKVNLIEKLLAVVLSKMSNFIPEAGIWMNTQRPEWNDANNALVGNGVSMVTLYYLRRFLHFFQQQLNASDQETIKISNEMVEFYHAVRAHLAQFSPLLKTGFSDTERKTVMDRLGLAASEYRFQVYNSGFWGKKRTHSMQGLKNFTQLCLDFIDHAILVNKRNNGLYHAYNLISIEQQAVSISHLPEMLEGQVAVLSSGFLSASESLSNLDALRQSALFREDQNSYLLYPNKALPGFIEKNTFSTAQISHSTLLNQLLKDQNTQIINQDIRGNCHFNGNFHNANDLGVALDNLTANPDYRELVKHEKALVLQLFESVFHHKAFTGRSGTFFGYEGLGSIYWHMVSKLYLSVAEVCEKAWDSNGNSSQFNQLFQHFESIGDGIGIHKNPQQYGAFPTDPYSHTPLNRGAQQPGMTGQVKEDILTRIDELGIKIKEGKLQFRPVLLKRDAFRSEASTVRFYNLAGTSQEVALQEHSLAFTYCQVPVIYQMGNDNSIELQYSKGFNEQINTLELPLETSKKIFLRTGEIVQVKVYLTADQLR